MLKYQTLFQRVVAHLIDGLLMSPFLLLETYIVIPESNTSLVVVWMIFFCLFATFYTILLHTFFGQTVGKMVMNVKVLDISEKPVSFKQAFLRDIAVVGYNVISCGMALYQVSTSGVTENQTPTSTQEILTNIFFGWQVVNLAVLISTEKRRALHDFIADTVVIRTNVEQEDENTGW